MKLVSVSTRPKYRTSSKGHGGDVTLQLSDQGCQRHADVTTTLGNRIGCLGFYTSRQQLGHVIHMYTKIDLVSKFYKIIFFLLIAVPCVQVNSKAGLCEVFKQGPL